ncbi:hypothetical protein B0H10DRAFT_2069598, partial [Mycena sp. CBHHK59/15]
SSTNCMPDYFGAIVVSIIQPWGLRKHLFHTFESTEQRFQALRTSSLNLCELVCTGSMKSAIL